VFWVKFFLDFEATQGSEEIISIGCVSETGEEFYSLTHSRHKVKPFITQLTGLTQKDINTAPSHDEVFSKFYDWIIRLSPKNAELYAYGDTDSVFCKNTIPYARTLKAQAMLGLLASNLKDFSTEVQKFFHLDKKANLFITQSLLLEDAVLCQSHNALEDAKMLKQIYCSMSNTSLDRNTRLFADNYYFLIEAIDAKTEQIYEYRGLWWAAHQFAKETGMPLEKINIAKIENRIKAAAKGNHLYGNRYWRIYQGEKPLENK
jgi:inhibitor of KinA sporulation pathway (predicted exonuclease)